MVQISLHVFLEQVHRLDTTRNAPGWTVGFISIIRSLRISSHPPEDFIYDKIENPIHFPGS